MNSRTPTCPPGQVPRRVPRALSLSQTASAVAKTGQENLKKSPVGAADQIQPSRRQPESACPQRRTDLRLLHRSGRPFRGFGVRVPGALLRQRVQRTEVYLVDVPQAVARPIRSLAGGNVPGL